MTDRPLRHDRQGGWINRASTGLTSRRRIGRHGAVCGVAPRSHMARYVPSSLLASGPMALRPARSGQTGRRSRCGRAALAWVLMIVMSGGGAAGCNKAESSAKAKKKKGPAGPPVVNVIKPERTAGGEVILGTIVASLQITITPQATGRIRKIHAKLGDFVKE